MYVIGRTHGHTKATAEYKMFTCDDTIYPYGCKLNENATHCFIFDCQKFGMNDNTAFCVEINQTKLTYGEKLQTNIFGLFVYGCPAYIEEIGINPRTGNENWWIK